MVPIEQRIRAQMEQEKLTDRPLSPAHVSPFAMSGEQSTVAFAESHAYDTKQDSPREDATLALNNSSANIAATHEHHHQPEWQTRVSSVQRDESTLQLLLKQIVVKQTEVRSAIRTLDEKQQRFDNGHYAAQVAVYETEIAAQRQQIQHLQENTLTAQQQHDSAQQQLQKVSKQLQDTEQQVLVHKQFIVQLEQQKLQLHTDSQQLQQLIEERLQLEADIYKQIQLKQAQLTLLQQQASNTESAYTALQTQYEAGCVQLNSIGAQLDSRMEQQVQLEQTLQSKQAAIQGSEHKIQQKEHELALLQQTMEHTQQLIQQYELKEQQTQKHMKEVQSECLNIELEQRNKLADLETVQHQLSERQQAEQQLNEQLQNVQQQIQAKQLQLSELTAEGLLKAAQQKQQLELHEQRVSEMQNMLRTRDGIQQEINRLQQECQRLQHACEQYNGELQRCQQLQAEAQQHHALLQQLQQHIVNSKETIQQLDESMKQKQQQAEVVQKSLQQQEEKLASHSRWVSTHPVLCCRLPNCALSVYLSHVLCCNVSCAVAAFALCSEYAAVQSNFAQLNAEIQGRRSQLEIVQSQLTHAQQELANTQAVSNFSILTACIQRSLL